MFDENPFESAPQANVFQTGGNENTSAPKATPPFGSPSFSKENKDNRYNIMNMFWLINPKLYTPKETPLLENEVHFCTIAYNINFGNLRIELSNMTNDSIANNTMICMDKMQRIVAGTVYPSAMFQLVMGVPEVICFEQIIKYTGEDWQKNRPATKFHKTADNNIIFTVDKHVYEFSGWQKDALIGSCKFALTQGMQLTGMVNFFK